MSGLTHGRVGDAGPALLLPCLISAEISPSGDGGSATRMFHKANGVFGAAGVPIRGAHCRTAPAESNLSQGVGWAKRRSRGRSVSAEVASAVSHQRTLAAYRTRESWSRTRRVVAKAEWLRNGANPRFVVTSLPREVAGAQYLYEKLYCARGDMEKSFAVQPCASRSTCPRAIAAVHWRQCRTVNAGSGCSSALDWSLVPAGRGDRTSQDRSCRSLLPGAPRQFCAGDAALLLLIRISHSKDGASGRVGVIQECPRRCGASAD